MFDIVAILLTLVVAVADSSPEVSINRLDGTKFTGQLQEWNEERVVISTPDGQQHLDLAELLSMTTEADKPATAAEQSVPAAELELVDGSQIPVIDFRSTGSQIAVTPPKQLGEGNHAFAVPRMAVAAVRLLPLNDTTSKQWREIRAIDFVSDVLVLLKRGGKSLDHVEGVVGDVSAHKIEFKLEGESLRIDRSKVAGILFYRRTAQRMAEPRCIVTGKTGLRVSAVQASATQGMATLKTASGVSFEWPFSDIASVDFSAGKLLYLSDIEPAEETWTPLVGLPAGASLAAEYGRPRRDTSAYGGPLMLRMNDSLDSSQSGQLQSFDKGLAVRSRTELAYRIPNGFTRFVSLAGIDPSTSANGDARLTIYGDEELLLNEQVAGGEAPKPIEVDITGMKRLRVVVEYGSNFDTGDWMNLCNARLLK